MARKAKLKGITQADLYIDRDGKEFSHAFLLLRSGPSALDVKARIEFQANRLDRHHDSLIVRKPDPAKDWPAAQWDYGSTPYGNFYGAHLDPGTDIRANANFPDVAILKAYSDLLSTVQAVVTEYNLTYVYPHCELQLWVAALEKLGVPVTTTLRLRGQDVQRYDLPEDQRGPAARFFAEMKENERAAQEGQGA
jgi:hypothetical protein